jgi:hypothetical protein
MSGRSRAPLDVGRLDSQDVGPGHGDQTTANIALVSQSTSSSAVHPQCLRLPVYFRDGEHPEEMGGSF